VELTVACSACREISLNKKRIKKNHIIAVIELHNAVVLAYKCVTPGNPCATISCHPHSYCRVSNITNNAICEPFCGSDNGGCRRDQICRIQEFECDGQCDPYHYLYCENSPLGKLIHTGERNFQNAGQMPAALSCVLWEN